MALFFDSPWFDARLAAAHLSRGDLARVLGLSENQIAEMWKDQAEVSVREVALMAALLGAPPEELARRAAISTPVPKQGDAGLERIQARLSRIEKLLAQLLARKAP